MNYRIIFHTTGKVLLAEAGLLALPLLVSVLYHERCAWALLASHGRGGGDRRTAYAAGPAPPPHVLQSGGLHHCGPGVGAAVGGGGAALLDFSREIPSYADAFSRRSAASPLRVRLF